MTITLIGPLHIGISRFEKRKSLEVSEKQLQQSPASIHSSNIQWRHIDKNKLSKDYIYVCVYISGQPFTKLMSIVIMSQGLIQDLEGGGGGGGVKYAAVEKLSDHFHVVTWWLHTTMSEYECT